MKEKQGLWLTRENFKVLLVALGSTLKPSMETSIICLRSTCGHVPTVFLIPKICFPDPKDLFSWSQGSCFATLESGLPEPSFHPTRSAFCIFLMPRLYLVWGLFPTIRQQNHNWLTGSLRPNCSPCEVWIQARFQVFLHRMERLTDFSAKSRLWTVFKQTKPFIFYHKLPPLWAAFRHLVIPIGYEYTLGHFCFI